ncbi:MAG: inositol monophosphatase family protein [Acidimicrobiales bacterium]
MAKTLIETMRECAFEIGAVVGEHRGRGLSGQRPTQYYLDLAADEVAVGFLTGAGLRVVSEESGVSGHGEVTVVVDPIDGSTNCDRGIPFYATSLAAVRDGELVAGLVVNLATSTVFEAELGSGAMRNAEPIRVSDARALASSIVSFSGTPSRHLGWAQSRALGAASLEICLVADGSLDAYAVAQQSTLHPWDYLAGLLVVREAGGVATDYRDEDLVIVDAHARRPLFAASGDLLESLRRHGPL